MLGIPFVSFSVIFSAELETERKIKICLNQFCFIDGAIKTGEYVLELIFNISD